MKKGLGTCKGNYYEVIRNPFYCGRVFIPAYKDEHEQTVKGIHEPIITEELFDQVQRVLDRKKKSEIK